MIRRWTFRCYPTAEQEKILSRTFGCCRYIYNWGLQLRTAGFKDGKKINYVESSAALTLLKKQPDRAWLNEVSCVPLQQTLRHLQVAFSNFFDKRSKYPTFKKKGCKDAAEYTQSAFTYEVNNQRLILAKMKDVPLKIKWSRKLTQQPTSLTITRKPSGHYFVSFVVEVDAPVVAKTGQSVGMDFGISRLATLSTGERIANPKHGARLQKRLALAQKSLFRKKRIVDPVTGKKRDSKRRAKQKRAVALIHEKIGNARLDTIHKLTTRIVKEFDFIAIEDLNLRGMVKNHNLARSLHDAGIGMCARMLESKAASAGKTVVKIDRWYPSSKTCSHCGYLLEKLSLSCREWTCPSCQTHHDRDDNAAINILAVGQTVTAHGDGVRVVRTSVRKTNRLRSANRPVVSTTGIPGL